MQKLVYFVRSSLCIYPVIDYSTKLPVVFAGGESTGFVSATPSVQEKRVLSSDRLWIFMEYVQGRRSPNLFVIVESSPTHDFSVFDIPLQLIEREKAKKERS